MGYPAVKFCIFFAKFARFLLICGSSSPWVLFSGTYIAVQSVARCEGRLGGDRRRDGRRSGVGGWPGGQLVHPLGGTRESGLLLLPPNFSETKARNFTKSGRAKLGIASRNLGSFPTLFQRQPCNSRLRRPSPRSGPSSSLSSPIWLQLDSAFVCLARLRFRTTASTSGSIESYVARSR